MRFILIGALLAAAASSAFAQQRLPLTDWRARVDADLATIPMDRRGQYAIMEIMQRYEQEAAIAKAQEAAAKAKEEAGK